MVENVVCVFNTLRPRQNGRPFADDTFKRIFLNENVRISIKISLKFVPKGPINYNQPLVQVMAWRRSGDKPLSEPIMVSLLTHVCVTRPQCFNIIKVDGCRAVGFVFYLWLISVLGSSAFMYWCLSVYEYIVRPSWCRSYWELVQYLLGLMTVLLEISFLLVFAKVKTYVVLL